MSMIGNLLRVTKAELEGYLNDSSLLEARLYGENENPDYQNPDDIDKAWDGILFLLTGDGISEINHPLTKVLFSGQLIDENQDLGYGPAHYLTPEQVVDLSKQIAEITVNDLKLKFDPEKMTELGIYPEIWAEGDDAFEYLADNFLVVQKMYAEAAKNGEGMITYLN
ncbi:MULTISPECIES: YfbM family protein [unclassified Chryseobacterium]|uniref:YfbM family protein n=1 Tax=unclassified Chryseobacterium TaxID=2593645 RepID=UPI00226A2616|nr:MULTISPECIES: YfbM family protein [unclassified Chryseobacterium]